MLVVANPGFCVAVPDKGHGAAGRGRCEHDGPPLGLGENEIDLNSSKYLSFYDFLRTLTLFFTLIRSVCA